MADTIEEIPIEESEEVEEPIAPPPPIRPKAKGRPKGAPSKPKNKKVLVQPVSPPANTESSSSEEEPPPPKKRKPRAETQWEPPSTHTIASEVLQMLSNRHGERSAAKREKYRSWFN
jgi:hypothetical protein